MKNRSLLRVVACALHVVFVVLAAGPSEAGESWLLSNGPHVRPTSSSTREVVERGLQRSPLFRRLVAVLEASNLIVYVTDDARVRSPFAGFLTFMGSGGGHRYVRVHLPSHRAPVTLVSALGHELQHAVEVAECPQVVDASSLAHLYQAVGYDAMVSRPGRYFESRAAIETGRQVYTEMMAWKPTPFEADASPDLRVLE